MTDAASSPQLESGTYEILRNRLRAQGDELKSRLAELNANRKEVFGSVDFQLLETERVTTEHHCVPRDMVAIGNRFLFGYNVHFGLRAERLVSDVFAAYDFVRDTGQQQSHGALHAAGLEFLADARFEKDFQDVYRYYKNATFSRFFVRAPYMYMVFQVGREARDIKSFKWLLEDESLRYLDNRSDHEVRLPPQHEFEWTRTTRDSHRHGAHPHISIRDRLFVETVGGDLTIKIENNTDSGEGIYSEPVDNADQTLDDAEISYAIVGNVILLKIRPYQETRWRYILFNEKLQQALRLDAIEAACLLLPDDHGLIFSSGYYLQTGERKLFDTSVQGLVFDRRIVSPNGEDTLFVFSQPETGDYVLLGYNVIAQSVETPIVCSGFTLFDDGRMLLFKTHAEPQKHHAVQIWQTPYTGEDYQTPARTDSFLYKVGNREIVRGMAECHEILTLINKEDSYADLYVDIVKRATDILDSYFWISHAELANLAEPLQQIRTAAATAVDEFEKVVRQRRNTQQATLTVVRKTEEVQNEVGRRQYSQIDAFVKSLAALRSLRGEIIGLKELRYVDLEQVNALEEQVAQSTDQLSKRCVDFLLQESALQPYADAIAAEQAGIDSLQKVTDARAVEQNVSASAQELEMLIEIVSNLKIDDATRRTTIIDNISAIFSQVNAARASLKRKIQELASVEGAAEFSSQLKLLNQSVVNAIDLCDSPDRCEEALTRLMVQLEELEGKFAEFDEFVVQLAEKREEITGAFESRRMQLIERRNQRANALAQAADRILKGIKNRVDSFTTISEIHGYFAADLMIEKVHNILRDLTELGDTVKVDDLQSRLKTIREDAVRQLKDRQELYEDGQNIIRFGKHRFSVNTQVLDLTTVVRDGRLNLHLTGTNFYEPADDPQLNQLLQDYQDVAVMEVVSENREVYRAEYLAYQMLRAFRDNHEELLRDSQAGDWLAAVQKFMGPRYREGYLKGVHDHDAALILQALIEIDSQCGLLRFSPSARALAALYWDSFAENRRKKLLEAQLAGYGSMERLYPQARSRNEYLRQLRELLREFVAEQSGDSSQTGLPETFTAGETVEEAAEYLLAELCADDRSQRGNRFVISQAAVTLITGFEEQLRERREEATFQNSLKALGKDRLAKLQLARDWLRGYATSTSGLEAEQDVLDEAALLLTGEPVDERAVLSVALTRELSGLIGHHAVLQGGNYSLRFNRFLQKLERFEREVVPRFDLYQNLKTRLVDSARDAMKLAEFQPRVLTSFVRNKLIDEVYLPLIGDNLAKQIGTVGEGTRTDRQGLLLLISPPGYGKTTLMEYISNRLGIIFMKINGPALGHEVTSLDPGSAPNASAREEVDKLNLALEMGDNVMIYLDDIQHCHPEFLQKFISLCDAQRKIEGVWKGKTRTYDFRGKKVAVVMAGNPYTESGEKFRIPDMLANRADIYNLGEIIGETREAFELSYLENALTSNPVLGQLAARSQQDVHSVIKLAQQVRRPGEPVHQAGLDFEGSYSPEELTEFADVMAKLMRVRDVVLAVNREYISSAAQHDDYRTEPPFLLQGSYRNMNRIAEKVLPVMNDRELESLIQSSYQNDAQTLTQGTESNLLKFKALLGILTADEQQRWDDIRRTFQQNVRLRGMGSDDQAGQLIATLMTFSDGLESIRKAVGEATAAMARNNGDEEMQRVAGQLQGLSETVSTAIGQIGSLAQRPIQVDVPPIEVKWPESLPGPSPQPEPAPEPRSPGGEETADRGERITIVNRLPRAVYGVMESQFALMKDWLKPLTELSRQQHQELSTLRPVIEECMSSYRELLKRLEDAQSAGESSESVKSRDSFGR